MHRIKLKQVDFSDGRIVSNIFHTAVPMLVAQVLNLLYSIVDRIYIGRIPETGTAALGGIGLCFPIIMIITAFTNLYGMGGSPLCAMERGRRDLQKADRIMNTAFFLLVTTSFVIIAVGEIFARPLMMLFGASQGNLPYALAYLRIYLLGTSFSMIATGMNPYINAQGFSGAGMVTVMIGAVCNILLDPLFIFIFGMGIQGAAIATVISQLLSAYFVLRFLTGRGVELHLVLIRPSEFAKSTELHRISADIIGLGAVAFIMQITNSLVNIACNSVLSHFGGDLYVSIMTIVNSVRQMMETPVLAIGEGSSPVISYNYGARRPANVRKAIFIMSCISIAYTAIVWALIEWKPALFISVFSSDTSLLEDAIPALHLYFFAFVFQALQYSGQTTFKALGKKKRAIFFSLFRKVVMVVPLTYLLPYVMGLGTDGVFMAEPISNFVGGSACFITMLLTIMPELRAMEQSTDAV